LSPKIAIYLCECGPNIKDAVDLGDLEKYGHSLKHVVLVKQHGLLCSAEGRETLTEDIKQHGLTGVVISACSPKEHEATFQAVLREAGLNPYMLQVANIREQCAWVVQDKAAATRKAKALLNAAVKRVVHHEPLEGKEIECEPDVLVLGAGVAGISAALTLARTERRVYLVEKSPCIGGKVARYEDLFPTMECGSCVMDPLFDQVLHHDRIEVITLASVQEVLGFLGNFQVRLKRRPRSVDPETCIGCGACVEACPASAANEYNEHVDTRKAIHIPYANALPHVAVIDRENCLRWQGAACTACREACPFGSINYEDAEETREIQVGGIVVATGFDLFDLSRAPQYGYGAIENVYTSLEFERMLSATGPTRGKIQLRNGETPSRIAMIHCVGSRSKNFDEHCSGICCSYLLKFTRQCLERLPEASVEMLYADWCLPGKEAQGFFNGVAKEPRVTFSRMQAPNALRIVKHDGAIQVDYTDINGNAGAIHCDMVVLAPAMEGAKDSEELSNILELARGKAAFFEEEDVTIAPISSNRAGIYIAGCARGPKDIQGSLTEGQAAAGQLLAGLIPGQKIAISPLVAQADEHLCSGCRTCAPLCPYGAIGYDDRQDCAVINEVLCRGCGVCAAACPGGAIRASHCTGPQLSAEIKGLLSKKVLDDSR
jgi:heterodisulfide reductase subunit A